MKLTFVGCGDAFGSGGRFNTCFFVEAASSAFLIDCGASALIGLKKSDIDRNAIKAIFITHFHADHCGGIPFFMLDAQFIARRKEPLEIAGPPGLKAWFERAMDAAFPGSAATPWGFRLSLIELAEGAAWHSSTGVQVLPRRVLHGKPEGQFFAYRISADGKVLAYTGDTEWTDTLIEIARNADLLIAEAYYYEKRIPLHLSYLILLEKLPLLQAKRLILTHMSEDMLSRRDSVSHECAYDGLTVHL